MIQLRKRWAIGPGKPLAGARWSEMKEFVELRLASRYQLQLRYNTVPAMTNVGLVSAVARHVLLNVGSRYSWVPLSYSFYDRLSKRTRLPE
jgi:hypothetical protein